MNRTCILSFLMVALVATTSRAAAIAYDGFNYANDDDVLHEENGGFGWAAPWNDADGDFHRLTMDDTSLISPAYPFQVGGDRLSGSGAGEATRLFNAEFDMSQDGNVFYASALFAKNANGGTSGDNVEFALGNNGSATFRAGGGSDEAFFLGSSAVTSAGAGRFMEIGEVYMIVLKVTSNAATPDLLQAVFYSSNDKVPATEPAVWDLENNLINSNAVINSFRLVTGANADGAFDEVRLGDTWVGTAVPEPATFALFILSAIAVSLSGRLRR